MKWVVLFLALASPAAADWSQFRGGAEQRGVADGPLPAKPEVVWTFRTGEAGIETTPAIAGGKVFLGTLDGVFVGLDLATGKELWRFKIPGEHPPEIKSSALVADGKVIFGDEGGTLWALDVATGKKLWSFQAEGAISSSPNTAQGLVVFGAYDNFLYALKSDGTLAWKLETGGYVHGTPAITGGKVLSSGCDGLLRQVDLASGKQLSELQIGSYVAASPAVAGGKVFAGTFDNQVVAVDLAAPKVAWQVKDPEREFPFYASAAVTDKVVIFGGRDKRVHALEPATGKVLWRHASRGRVDASPVIAGDRVFIADLAGLVAALDLKTGEVGWEFDSGEGFAGSPAVTGGKLVIASTDGTVYCFGGAKK